MSRHWPVREIRLRWYIAGYAALGPVVGAIAGATEPGLTVTSGALMGLALVAATLGLGAIVAAALCLIGGALFALFFLSRAVARFIWPPPDTRAQGP